MGGGLCECGGGGVTIFIVLYDLGIFCFFTVLCLYYYFHLYPSSFLPYFLSIFTLYSSLFFFLLFQRYTINSIFCTRRKLYQ